MTHFWLVPFIERFIERSGDKPDILPVTRVETRLFCFARAKNAWFDETWKLTIKNCSGIPGQLTAYLFDVVYNFVDSCGIWIFFFRPCTSSHSVFHSYIYNRNVTGWKPSLDLVQRDEIKIRMAKYKRCKLEIIWEIFSVENLLFCHEMKVFRRIS